MLAVGMHRFAKPLLKAYREAVVDPQLGPELAALIPSLAQQGYSVGEKTYKRTPRGYDSEHPYAELLLYSGLTAGVEVDSPAELHSAALLEYCYQHYQALTPMIHWLQQMKV